MHELPHLHPEEQLESSIPQWQSLLHTTEEPGDGLQEQNMPSSSRRLFIFFVRYMLRLIKLYGAGFSLVNHSGSSKSLGVPICFINLPNTCPIWLHSEFFLVTGIDSNSLSTRLPNDNTPNPRSRSPRFRRSGRQTNPAIH